MSLVDLIINRPSEIRHILSHSFLAAGDCHHDSDDDSNFSHPLENKDGTCFIRQLLKEDEYQDRIKHLERCELITLPHELSLDFNYTNAIERCIWKEET